MYKNILFITYLFLTSCVPHVQQQNYYDMETDPLYGDIATFYKSETKDVVRRVERKEISFEEGEMLLTRLQREAMEQLLERAKTLKYLRQM